MEKITHITKEEARLTARLYVAGLFTYQDGFNTDTRESATNEFSTNEVNEKIQNEIDLIIQEIMKKIDIDAPVTAYDCIIQAKKMIQNKKKNARAETRGY